jgi:SNF2 family DNA or RNA helicase
MNVGIYHHNLASLTFKTATMLQTNNYYKMKMNEEIYDLELDVPNYNEVSDDDISDVYEMDDYGFDADDAEDLDDFGVSMKDEVVPQIDTFELDKCMNNFSKFITNANLEYKSYQADGGKWCISKEITTNPLFNVRGGLIADEMGLGKTILMIGTIVSNPVGPTLIVLPVALLEQWSDQLFKTTGTKPYVYHGTNKKTCSMKLLSTQTCVLTTYSAVAIKKKNGEKNLLHEMNWGRLVFDEAHHLRNKTTGTFIGASALKGTYVWLITGTPVQNKKRDFYNLCEILRIPASIYKTKDGLVNIRNSVVLRRTKKQVGLLLPKVVEKIVNVRWESEREKCLARDIHNSLNLYNRTTDREEDEGVQVAGAPLNNVLTQMCLAKQSCIGLLTEAHLQNLQKEGVLTRPVKEYMEVIQQNFSKINAVVNTVLSLKDNGCGKLIFTNYHRESDIIQQRLNEGGMTNTAIYDGRLLQSKKKHVLCEKHDALIIQIQTGCEGLNLQANYSEIYFVTPHWNPSVEDQAVARCHRMGQTKTVMVYRFEMDNLKNEENITMDNYVNVVQEKKRILVRQLYQEA